VFQSGWTVAESNKSRRFNQKTEQGHWKRALIKKKANDWNRIIEILALSREKKEQYLNGKIKSYWTIILTESWVSIKNKLPISY
jgi:hypothetical protein